LYIREGTLYSHGFDPEDMELRGEPVAETDLTAVFSILPASASDTGVLVYRRPGGVRQFIWMDRDGIVLDRIGSIMGSNAASPELSPDGDQAVFEQSSGSTGQINLWLLDLVRGGSAAPFTFENHIVAQPAWAPDGRIAFFSDLNFPDREILARPSDGVGSEELLLAVPGKQLLPQDWAADGQFLLFDQIEPDTSELQIWALESGSNEPILIVNSPGSDLHGQFSPEADWIAYESDRSGTTEVYIQPFDGSGAAVPVSIGGGDQARWNPDGTEVFYVAPPSQLMSVTLDFSTDRRTVERGQPDELFTAPLGGPSRSRGQFYDVSSDGEKFLILSMLETAPPVTVILNWNPNDE
jgi:Tol biopolymer transport system component